MPEELKGPIPEFDHDCKETIDKFVSVALPVKVTPEVEVKPVKTECCGRPIITPGKHHKCELGKENGDCEFVIIQKMKVEIPVKFKIKTDVEDPFVDCEVRRDEEHERD